MCCKKGVNMSENSEDFYQEVAKQIRKVVYELRQIQRNWAKEKGLVPFSSYVPVIQYFLRTQTDLDVKRVSIKSRGKSIIILVKPEQRMDIIHVGCEISPDDMQLYTSTLRELSNDEILRKYAEDFPKYCKRHGLEPEDFGKEFTLDSGKTYRIIGCKERKQTYGIVCLSLENSRRTNIRTAAVLAALKKGVKK